MALEARRKTVLVTGANGFIGNAAAKAFVAAGYITYGLVRRAEAIDSLLLEEIVPILGTPDDISTWLPDLQSKSKSFDVLVSNTENLFDYEPHFNNVLNMLKQLAKSSVESGVKPLLIFASGCKDYGKGPFHSDHVAPFTEDSPLSPEPVLVPRCNLSLTMFDYPALWDAIITRPTTLFGGSGSYYGAAFQVAAAAATKPKGEQRLKVAANPNSIVHGTHVADVATAYVGLAVAHAKGQQVAGQCYNISTGSYETAKEVADALVREYELEGVDWVSESTESENRQGFDVVGLLFGFSQWIGSEKIRRDIGWKDARPLFTHSLHTYRLAYEAAARAEHSNVSRIKEFIDLWNEGGKS